MPEPQSTTAAGVAIGAGIGITGTIMGAQVDALLVGLIAAVLISFWLPSIDDRPRAAAAVAMSSLLAGYGSPVAAGWLVSEQHMQSGDPLRLLVALVIGLLAPAGVPVLMGWLKRKAEVAG